MSETGSHTSLRHPKASSHSRLWRTGVTALAPAKVNLDLRVIGRRDDGYHELRSRFLAVSLFDTLEVRTGGQGIELSVHGGSHDVPTDASNLVVRAVDSIRQAFERSHSVGDVRIRLTKRIPSQAGLGGGSSDAVSAAHAVCRLWGIRTDRPEVAEAVNSLGSDLAFFHAGWPLAECRGRGEIVNPVRDGAEGFYVLAKPDFGLPSGDVFRHFGQCEASENIRTSRFRGDHAVRGGQKSVLNDLQEAACSLDVRYARWLQRLEGVPSSDVTGGWTMSGSGTTAFSRVPTWTSGRRLATTVRGQLGCWCQVVAPVAARLWSVHLLDN